jgi:hypothetical protein
MRSRAKTIDSKEESKCKQPTPQRLRTGLLVLGSAFLGGIAVAFWNRRSLADMQNEAQKRPSIQPPADDDAIY